MKKTSLLLLMTLSVTAPLVTALAKPAKIPRSYEPYLEDDMNQIPIVMDESLYKMSCADIKKNSLAIKVLQDEMHTYMIRTDAMMIKLNKVEAVVKDLQEHRPWYKRLFHKK
jgi:hypothetical protein